MTRIGDHTAADGTIDWNAYRRAQIATGDVCCTCGTYIIFNAKGGRTKCHECEGMTEPEACEHSSLLRCPACGETWDPADAEDYQVYTAAQCEESAEVFCGKCDHAFEVAGRVSYMFKSPARIKE